MAHHPAPYSAPVVELMGRLLGQYPGRVHALDPQAGVGRGLLALPFKSKVTLVELEPEWAEDCRLLALGKLLSDLDVTVVCGDSRKVIPRRKYTHVIFSPAYGNRMKDKLRTKPGTRCRSYAQSLGRDLNVANTGAYSFGQEYFDLNAEIMTQALARLQPGGEVWINVSDFYKTYAKGEPPRRVQVTQWWINLLDDMGMQLKEAHPIMTKRFKEGENRHRVPFESLLIFADARGIPESTRKAVGRQKR